MTFIEHRTLYCTDAIVPEPSFTVEFGTVRTVRTGDDITIVGITNMVVECLRAQELAAEIGILTKVIDPISLVPLDMETIISSIR